MVEVETFTAVDIDCVHWDTWAEAEKTFVHNRGQHTPIEEINAWVYCEC